MEGVTVRSHEELADLVAAQRLRAMGVGWTAAAIVLGIVALMTGGLALALWAASVHAYLVLAVLTAGAAVLSVAGSRKARRRNAEARDRIEQAWEKAAGNVLAARGAELTAPELAAMMQTDQAHAESLLGRLSAHGRARVDVRDDAELAYRVADADPEIANDADAAAPRLRAR